MSESCVSLVFDHISRTPQFNSLQPFSKRVQTLVASLPAAGGDKPVVSYQDMDAILLNEETLGLLVVRNQRMVAHLHPAARWHQTDFACGVI